MTLAAAAPAQRRAAPEPRAVFERLRARAPAMARTTAAERIERLRRLRRAIEDRRVAIAEAIRMDFGRPSAETEVAEIHAALSEIDHTTRHLRRWMEPERASFSLLLAGTSTRIHYEPRGVVLILAPWNYPFILVVHPLIAAVAAGNCAICKPSEKTPHITRLLGELIAATFDEAEVAVVEGGPEAAEALLALPFDHIFFTGSTVIGKKVMAAAAAHLASVTLELGGKSPVVIDASANPAAAAERIALGKFINAGQTCVAPDYVFVHRSRERAFLDAMRGVIERFYGDAASQRRTADYARIVDAGHFRRLAAMIDGSVAAGARVATGGERDEASRYIAPTVLSGVRPDMPVMREEIFGPVLPVMAYDDTTDVIAHIQAHGKPLAMYVFSGDQLAADALVARTSAGSTAINNVGMFYFHHGLPFGGVGASGMGSYHGVHGFRTFSHARPVLRQHEPALVKIFFPPYRGRLHELGQKLLRWL